MFAGQGLSKVFSLTNTINKFFICFFEIVDYWNYWNFENAYWNPPQNSLLCDWLLSCLFHHTVVIGTIQSKGYHASLLPILATAYRGGVGRRQFKRHPKNEFFFILIFVVICTGMGTRCTAIATTAWLWYRTTAACTAQGTAETTTMTGQLCSWPHR